MSVPMVRVWSGARRVSRSKYRMLNWDRVSRKGMFTTAWGCELPRKTRQGGSGPKTGAGGDNGEPSAHPGAGWRKPTSDFPPLKRAGATSNCRLRWSCEVCRMSLILRRSRLPISFIPFMTYNAMLSGQLLPSRRARLSTLGQPNNALSSTRPQCLCTPIQQIQAIQCSKWRPISLFRGEAVRR